MSFDWKVKINNFNNLTIRKHAARLQIWKFGISCLIFIEELANVVGSVVSTRTVKHLK